jgi:uncharacterized membrane protein YbhN (UPF0104 family)
MHPGTGSKPTADRGLIAAWTSRGPGYRLRVALGIVGALLALGVIALVIIPRAGEVGDALSRVGWGEFALIVLLGGVAMILRTTAWQVAIDAAGGRVRPLEAHPASAISYLVALISTYLGVLTRIAVIRHRVPDRSPTTSQQIAAESALVVVEGALVGALLLCSSWTLGIPFPEALALFIGGLVAAVLLVLAARRFAERRFGPGLAVARQPRTLGLVTLSIGGTLGAQLIRVGLTLGSVGLSTSPLVVIAVFLASGIGAVIPIGTAASGAAAPLIAVSAEGGTVADATAAGVVLSGALLISCILYALVAVVAAALHNRGGPGPSEARLRHE